jgi:enoyl-[acyl-carrier-protein] reductase (NADH)
MMMKIPRNRPINVTHSLKVTVPRTERKVALVMGVYNWRSIAWYAVKNLLASGYDCIMTFEEQNSDEIQALGSEHMIDIQKQNDGIPEDEAEFLDRAVEKELNLPLRYVKQQDTKLAGLVCDVETDLPNLFQEKIPEMLEEFGAKQLDCIIHSVAHIDLGRNRRDKPLLKTAAVAYHQAQHVTTYSLLETARQAIQKTNLLNQEAL